jgi:phosphoglycolate phosphatase
MIYNAFKALIFDFDYTLADSSRGIIQCTNHALESMDLSAVSNDAVCRTIGMSLKDSFETLTSISDPVQAAEFSRLFISKADDVMVDSTELLDYAPHVIRGLKQHGFSLGIVSTKYRHRIEAVLAREGLLDLIDVIIGGEDVTCHKPDPEGLFKALEKLETLSTSALYVGDSIIDAIVAERAGTPFLAVLSGTTTREAFNDYQRIAVIDNLAELPESLSRLRRASGSTYNEF